MAKKKPSKNLHTIRKNIDKKQSVITKKPITDLKKKPPKQATKLSRKPSHWGLENARILSLIGGTGIVGLWTVIRHITNGVNFDVVGQIGVAQQWAHGQMSGTQLGATSYLLKMPFYYVVNALHFLSPMNRILLIALVFNLLTFILLFLMFEKILKLYAVKQTSWLYLGMAWLATIAGNVFWLDYANSRNLETVGGIFFIYLILEFLCYSRLRTVVWLTLTSSVVFFADPLQFYVCGLGTSIFVISRWLLRRSPTNLLQMTGVLAAIASGYALSLGFIQLVKHFLHVSFLAISNNHASISISNLATSLRAIAINTLKIFGVDFYKRPYGFNSVRELLNAFVLLAIVVILIRVLIKSYKKTSSGLITTLIVVNYLAYVASGQVLGWQTSRYLIMVPLFIILLLASGGDQLKGKYASIIRYTWVSVVLISTVMLVGALVNSWPGRHTKDSHIYTLVSYMRQNNYAYALSSRDAGITATYFSGGKNTVLPMACQPDHAIEPTNLFFDNSGFLNLNLYSKDTPVIVPYGGIEFGPYTCTVADIIAQFGSPQRQEAIVGFGTGLVYSGDKIQFSGSNNPKIGRRLLDKMTAKQSSALPHLSGCSKGTLDVIVAHPDDDLLFMNPDLKNQLSVRCVRTIYVTAGDDGRHTGYWMRRQSGIEAAYASMIGLPNEWNDSLITLDDHNILTRTLNGYGAASLVFLRLPDGGTSGAGFADTGFSSIKNLYDNRKLVLSTIDGRSTYNYSQLAKIISSIIFADKPDRIFTSLSGGYLSSGDHSDHLQVGLLAVNAKASTKSRAILTQYVGYPSNSLPANLSTEQTAQKKAVFDVYASEDSAICIHLNNCQIIESTYGNYFSRMYKSDTVNNKIILEGSLPF